MARVHFLQTGHQIDAVTDSNDDLLMVRFSAEPPMPGAQVKFIEWPRGREGWASVTWTAEES